MISLIHPSRGRPHKAYDTALEWLTMAGTPVEYIISLDIDDPALQSYLKKFMTKRQVIAENKSVVEATNNAAKVATGDILLYLSDDFKCFENWGRVIESEFHWYRDQPTLLKVDDCLQTFDKEIVTIPIMNRALYETLGYFWHPGYKSMFVDEHLYHRAKKLGALQLAPHIQFEHCHVSVGKSPDDETYRRSAAHWNQGKQLFAQHKAAGFIE